MPNYSTERYKKGATKRPSCLILVRKHSIVPDMVDYNEE
jgi:hypothetical protein